MHQYTADPKERKEILKWLALLAIALAMVFGQLVQHSNFTIPWYVDPPAVAGFFGAVYWLFDNFLWRFKFGPFPLSRTPDLRGTWVGGIRSSFKDSSGKETEVPVVVHIRQQWSELSIELESSLSKSFTVMAAIDFNDNSLRYEYRNEPRYYGFPPEHRGSAHLELPRDSKVLKGKYYTSEGSNNTGTIILRFLSRKIIEYEDALKQAQP